MRRQTSDLVSEHPSPPSARQYAGLQTALEKASPEVWRQACIGLITDAPATAYPEVAHTCFAEFGQRVREKFGDDRLLVSALRPLLPRFAGVVGDQAFVLYRGENIERYQDGRVGLCWSPTRYVAKMFAPSGLWDGFAASEVCVSDMSGVQTSTKRSFR